MSSLRSGARGSVSARQRATRRRIAALVGRGRYRRAHDRAGAGRWVLTDLRRRRPTDLVFLDWASFNAAGAGLYLWETFVTEKAKATTHVDDAAIAVACFTAALPDPERANALTAERPLSLVGAAGLWAGWSDDAEFLRTPCLVLKAAERNPAA